MNIIQTLVVDNGKEKPPKTILAVKFFQLKAPFRIERCCQPAGVLPHFLQQLSADGQVFSDLGLSLQLKSQQVFSTAAANTGKTAAAGRKSCRQRCILTS